MLHTVNTTASKAVTDETFEQEVLKSDKPVIVEFWAEWRGPCHAVGPVLDEIAQEHADELRLAKVDVDKEMRLAQRYGVMSIPLVILFRDGRPDKTSLGAYPKAVLEDKLGLAQSPAS